MTKTILITGTSSGLGKATAELFHDRGWNVVATMRMPDRDAAFASSDRMLVTRLDVEDTGTIHSAVAAGIDRFGRIDALVNNAGYGAYGPLEATSLEAIRRQFDVNVLGVLAATKALLPHFRSNRGGTIVNVSSIGGRIAFPLGTLYHGSKFAVEGLSEAFRYELMPLGVRLKLVEPGGILTDFGGRSLDFSNDPTLTEYQPLIKGVMDVMGLMMANGSPPAMIAEVIYEAVTDGTDRLRYEAGADAIEMLANRRASDDAHFIGGMAATFGVAVPDQASAREAA